MQASVPTSDSLQMHSSAGSSWFHLLLLMRKAPASIARSSHIAAATSGTCRAAGHRDALTARLVLSSDTSAAQELWLPEAHLGLYTCCLRILGAWQNMHSTLRQLLQQGCDRHSCRREPSQPCQIRLNKLNAAASNTEDPGDLWRTCSSAVRTPQLCCLMDCFLKIEQRMQHKQHDWQACIQLSAEWHRPPGLTCEQGDGCRAATTAASGPDSPLSEGQ